MSFIKRPLLTFPVLLVFYELATYLSNDAYLPALPEVARDFATSHHYAQLSLSTWFLGASCFQLFMGPIADRFGRRPTLLWGGALFVIATVYCAMTTSVHTFLWLRFIQGATISSMVVAGYATIHDMYTHDKAITTLAWMYGITVLAPSMGPLFGALILYFASWRYIFAILGLFAFIILIALFFRMPETVKQSHRHPIVFKKIWGQYMRIFLNRVYMRKALCFCFLFTALIAWIVSGPFLVIDNFSYSILGFAVFQLLIFGAFIAATQSVKYLMARFSYLRIVQIGLVISLIGGVGAFAFAYLLPQSLIILVVMMMLVATGAGMVFPILNRSAIASSHEPMGARMAAFSSLMSGFAVLSSVLMSLAYQPSLLSLASILLIFTFLAFLIGMKVKLIKA